MYQKAYGIIETLAPLHVGASSGEENGNLNLIFRDQFTQTGIIPGSSIRGRFRADMRSHLPGSEHTWYGHEAVTGGENSGTTEAIVKFEYASLVWLPVFCPGQPIVWVTCPRFLKRYQQITGKTGQPPRPGDVKLKEDRKFLFFNLGFLDDLKPNENLSEWVPDGIKIDNLVVVEDSEIGIIHDMALYRQTRTAMKKDVKQVDNFFGFEALPEGSILIFPIAIKQAGWHPFTNKNCQNLYFGGLESIGCGRCHVTLSSEEYELCLGNPTL
jgi:CRISPR-associated protein Cmr4